MTTQSSLESPSCQPEQFQELFRFFAKHIQTESKLKSPNGYRLSIKLINMEDSCQWETKSPSSLTIQHDRMNFVLILGIETSCDETAVAIVEDGRKVHTSVIYSQIKDHQEWGGVIPEIASRLHSETIHRILNKAFKEASKSIGQETSIKEIDAIAVANCPGLVGSLLVGVNVAKTLAWVHQKPIIPVNHLFGHVCANFIDTDLEPPFMCLLASGGHTQIINIEEHGSMQILGETIDDAAGEAFDKVARLLNLPYPGGPHLDKLAKEATDLKKYSFPIAKVKGLDFSFSGLKTAVLRLKQKIGDEWEENRANIAYAFQDCVAKTFLKKVKLAAEEHGSDKLVIAGGVAANSRIRELFKEELDDEYELVFPSLKYCTDNAAMIAAAGYFMQNETLSNSEKLNFEVYSRV